MCVIALAIQADPRWPLVFAGNRDERHDRPSQPLHRWPDAPHVIGGRDLVAGGSWLGVSDQGRLAVVTNIRSDLAPDAARPSRGWLVRDVLAGVGDFAELERTDLSAFAPFNLLVIRNGEASLWSNAPTPGRKALAPGLYGLGNGALDEGTPRVRDLKNGLADRLEEAGDALEPLFDLLASGRDDAQSGFDSPPIFLRNPRYGTRCSTVVRVDREGLGVVAERRFDADGQAVGETTLTFSWPQVA